jgi:pimeloyl-ACP methyl ester carboxylesterase
MKGINLARVVLGGLLAGLIVNVGESVFNGWLFAAEMEAALARLNLPPVGGSAIGVFVLLGFSLGIALVWLYAAIRPRFGAGVNTALCAAAAVWFFAYVYPSVGFAVMGLFPTRLIAIGLVWGLGELMLAAVAGAWLYHEATVVSTRAGV